VIVYPNAERALAHVRRQRHDAQVRAQRTRTDRTPPVPWAVSASQAVAEAGISARRFADLLRERMPTTPLSSLAAETVADFRDGA
jgi:hypothetical protein